ncbi:MAG TPA: hypothetical protein VFE62_02865 [Gemmataceae bacterium]|nr:hypothetical protein [Gemmataceae bacterium]
MSKAQMQSSTNPIDKGTATEQTECYTYCFNGRDGTFDLVEIVSP